jgi:hypothetical protein
MGEVVNSLSKEYQNERGLMRNIYENFECHLGTIGLRTSTRCVELKSQVLKDGNHFEKEVVRKCEVFISGKSKQLCCLESSYPT